MESVSDSAVWAAAVVTPVRLAWEDGDARDQGLWAVWEGLLDAVFLLEVGLGFCAAFFDRAERLVDSRREIALNYVKSWFLLDMLAVLPLAYLG